MKNRFSTFYIKKQAFLDHENIAFKILQNSHFSKGFGRKFEILLTFPFKQNTRRKVFGDVLVRKQVFSDDRNMDLKKCKIGIFAKGMVYDFGKKVEVFPSFVFIKN